MLKMLGTCCAALGIVAFPVFAQDPPLPALIRIVVPFAAGASTDVAARAIASELAKRLGSNVIVENQAGASTFIGAAAVAKGPKDGSMILMTSASTVTGAVTRRIVPVDINADLVPVAMLSEGPLTVAASLQSNIKTPAELVAAARAKPDEITHGTGGVGSLPHITNELLNEAAKIEIRHIPYKSAALAVNDFAGGRIDLMIGTYSTVAAQVKAGRARLVAVTTPQPHPSFPGVPTMASVAPGFAVDLWVGFFVPAGTPAAIVRRLNRELNEVAKSAEVVQVIGVDGAVPRALTPEEFGGRVRASYTAWKKIAAEKNIVAE